MESRITFCAGVLVVWHGSESWRDQCSERCGLLLLFIGVMYLEVRRAVLVYTFSLFSKLCAGSHYFTAGLLDVGSQYSLVSKDTKLTGVRMVLKILIAATWAVLFIIYYRFSLAANPFT
jgi:hypothetical protein